MHICFHIFRTAIAHHSWLGTVVGEIMSISKYSKLSFEDPWLLPTYICCVYFMLNVAQVKYKCSRINRTMNTDIWELESSNCICNLYRYWMCKIIFLKNLIILHTHLSRITFPCGLIPWMAFHLICSSVLIWCIVTSCHVFSSWF